MAMKQALQQQIDEKKIKKDQEIHQKKLDDMRDELRVKEQMKVMAIAEGV